MHRCGRRLWRWGARRLLVGCIAGMGLHGSDASRPHAQDAKTTTLRPGGPSVVEFTPTGANTVRFKALGIKVTLGAELVRQGLVAVSGADPSRPKETIAARQLWDAMRDANAL